MKKNSIILLFLIINYSSFATEQGWYYVYIQMNYPQGPWQPARRLESSQNYNYLEARPCNDLFGSDQAAMAQTIFEHLQKEDTARFTFKSAISLDGDTVIIQTDRTIDDFEAVKNELVATFVLNSFGAVKIIQGDKSRLYHYKDISVPYMELFLPAEMIDTNEH